ncbi:hypothetical protein HAX54_031205 [Datura stramonium]|uniref:BURP domain-containing protein n=1 Tax=Datura stramonium TaxID=4076 RepID=A0ABS8VAW6_DATST|nr:hypothetical protein [Datura stramonium]
MDFKFGFCILSLNLLILLIAYGTEARKMAEGNLQGKRLNFPIPYEDVQKTDIYLWIYDNQGEYGYHKTARENVQVHPSSNNRNLENKDDTYFWIYNNQGESAHQGNHKSKKENAQVHPSSNNRNLENKEDTYFWIYNNQGESAHQGNHKSKKENAQVHPSSNNGNLENKDDTYFWIYSNQGESAHQGNHKSKKENAQVHPSSNNRNLENKDDTYFWIYNNQGENAQQTIQQVSDKQGANSYQQAKKENSHLRIHENRGENKHQQAKTEKTHIHSSSHMDHIDPSLRVFFLIDDLKLRKTITVSFPRRDLSSSPSFLPKEEADSIPFSLKELPNLLQHFSFSRNSAQAKAMADTLRECETPPIKGETKYCATSAEAMFDFVQGILGEKTQIKALSTIHFSNSTPPLQKYTILDVPQEVAAPKMVACHTMPYAYAIFYCHYTISKSKVFKVSLGGENGDRVEAIVVCHLDTSEWSPSHASFRLLGILPGTSPICHFFPSDNLVWVPKIATVQVL